MPHVRVFFAIDLPKAIKTHIKEMLSPLQTEESIHWSKPANLHITLQFLKTVRSKDLSALISHVRTELTLFQPFQLELGQLELFPSNHHKPHIISIHVEPNDILTDLAAHIGQGVIAAHYLTEARPFRPHLTVARINKPFPLIEIPPIPGFLVDEITFFQSLPSEQESHYSVLERIRLVRHPT